MPEVLTCLCGCQSWAICGTHAECERCGSEVYIRMLIAVALGEAKMMNEILRREPPAKMIWRKRVAIETSAP